MPKETLLKEISVEGVRSSNAFRQNLRRAKNRAKSTRERRTQTRRTRHPRTKIRLKVKNKTKDHKLPTLQTKKQKLKMKRKTLKRPRRVRWKDQETGTSLVSYSEETDDFKVRESPLFRSQKPLRMRFTQKRRRQSRPINIPRETNIIVRWKVHDDPVPGVMEDVEVIENIDSSEASKRLREVGIEPDRKAPLDLIKHLAILSHGFENGAIQSRG